MTRADGYLLITPPDGRPIEADTRQCVHCSGHWVVQPGSGNVRGYCMRCNGPVCGPGCAECRPIARRIDEALGQNPTAVSVPVLWVPSK